MKVYLTRHGETDWNLAQKIQGSSDTQLNETGILQAEQLADRLLADNIHPCCIYTSPLKRAFTTAQVLAEALHIPARPKSGLEEINFGSWEGLTWNQVKETYPEDYQLWHKDRRYRHPTNGESYQELLDRVLPALREIILLEGGPDSEKELLIVSHSAIIISLQAWMDDTPFHQMAARYRTENTGIVTFEAGRLWKD